MTKVGAAMYQKHSKGQKEMDSIGQIGLYLTKENKLFPKSIVFYPLFVHPAETCRDKRSIPLKGQRQSPRLAGVEVIKVVYGFDLVKMAGIFCCAQGMCQTEALFGAFVKTRVGPTRTDTTNVRLPSRANCEESPAGSGMVVE